MRNNKILKSIIAFVFVFGLILSNLSSVFVKAAGNTDVVIHKMKLADLADWPKTPNEDGTYPGVTGKYDGSKIADLTAYFGAGSQELAGVTFTYWKVADESTYNELLAAPDSYDTVEEVKAKLNNQDNGTVTAETTNEGVRVSDLAEGYYWFIENKGSNISDKNGDDLAGHSLAQAKAVPFGLVLPMSKADGTSFGTGEQALHVYPKNTTVVPKVDKDFGAELGGAANPDNPRSEDDKNNNLKPLDIGTKVPYEVVTKIPAGNEYQTASWSDRMTEGLTFNNDVVVTLDGTNLEQADYKVVATAKGFDLALTEAGLAKINKKAADQTIKITYSATLNSDAVVEIPESNDVTFHYGNNPTNDNTPKPNTPTPNKPNPDDQSLEVSKKWSGNNAPAGWEVTVTLYNAQTGKVVTLDGQDSTVTLNAGKTTHKWTGLDKDTEYKVVETKAISSFAPHYEEPTVAGQLVIDNVKTDNPQPLKPTEPKVVTYGKKFVKTDEKGTERLVGAEFLVKNAKGEYLSVKPTAEKTANIANYTAKEQEYAAKIAEYNGLSAEEQKGERGNQVKAQIETAKQERDLAFKSIRTNYNWTADKDAALVLTSDNEGRFEITGLAEGTYKLEEKTAPKGFAKLTEDIEFAVGAGTYSADKEGQIKYNLADAEGKKDAQQVKNKKVTIPQTGGIGTVIFTVVGALVMASSVIAMRRRKSEE